MLVYRMGLTEWNLWSYKAIFRILMWWCVKATINRGIPAIFGPLCCARPGEYCLLLLDLSYALPAAFPFFAGSQGF